MQAGGSRYDRRRASPTEAPAPVEPVAPSGAAAAQEKLPGEPPGYLERAQEANCRRPRRIKLRTLREACNGTEPCRRLQGIAKPGARPDVSTPPRRDEARVGWAPRWAGKADGPVGPLGWRVAFPAGRKRARENPCDERRPPKPPAASFRKRREGPPPGRCALVQGDVGARALFAARGRLYGSSAAFRVFVDGDRPANLVRASTRRRKVEISTEAKKDQAEAVTILIHKPRSAMRRRSRNLAVFRTVITLITPEAQV